ncbi:MAG: type II toxin-antitoxin system HicB family antitoxin [Hespellia sp.]|nr:type II toxin-antitoxin system HicB family antitoxin [Hespellia sp.]
MKMVYPVIFTQTKDRVLVEVPDMSILTEGNDLADAILMARDAIGVKGIAMEDDGEKLPDASNVYAIDLAAGVFKAEGKAILSMVDVDFDEYRRRNDNKSVRRNVTLPNWLNREAEKEKINVSKVLQEALMSRLGVYR